MCQTLVYLNITKGGHSKFSFLSLLPSPADPVCRMVPEYELLTNRWSTHTLVGETSDHCSLSLLFKNKIICLLSSVLELMCRSAQQHSYLFRYTLYIVFHFPNSMNEPTRSVIKMNQPLYFEWVYVCDTIFEC